MSKNYEKATIKRLEYIQERLNEIENKILSLETEKKELAEESKILRKSWNDGARKEYKIFIDTIKNVKKNVWEEHDGGIYYYEVLISIYFADDTSIKHRYTYNNLSNDAGTFCSKKYEDDYNKILTLCGFKTNKSVVAEFAVYIEDIIARYENEDVGDEEEDDNSDEKEDDNSEEEEDYSDG